jgi:hypothetical protein
MSVEKRIRSFARDARLALRADSLRPPTNLPLHAPPASDVAKKSAAVTLQCVGKNLLDLLRSMPFLLAPGPKQQFTRQEFA